MRGKLKSVAVLTVVVAACSSGGTPATTPTSVTTTTTSTTVPAPSSTTTTEATTTTLDRLAEIQAIFQDLEERRLQALYDGDREAFRALFANDEYMERSMGAFDVVEFEGAPSTPSVLIVDLVFESADCLAVKAVFDEVDGLVGSEERTRIVVLERSDEGWGYSYS
ncbi:MAG: hypothetical protein WBN71_09905, partial [Acidimicrobiia bacterium]